MESSERSFSRSPISSVFIVLSGFALILVVFLLRLPEEESTALPAISTPSSLPAARVPAVPAASALGNVRADWTIRSMRGETVSMGDLRGKIVVLNLWATWCLPCVEELPALDGLASRFDDDDDVAFVLLSNESPDVIERFVSRYRLRLPMFVDAGPRPPSFSASVVPATFIIDRAGQVRFQQIGAANWNDDRVVGFIRELSRENG